MTAPTLALGPSLCEDFRRSSSERRSVEGMYSAADIRRCFSRVTPVSLRRLYHVPGHPGLTLQCFNAGHVLGAAMVLVSYGGRSVFYTGDFQATPQRTLGAASLEGLRVRPDVLITESTFATTVRTFRRSQERAFQQLVRSCVLGGGKALISVSALGVAQELLVLLDELWNREPGLRPVPLFFAAGVLGAKALSVFKSFRAGTWCKPLEFRHVRMLQRADDSFFRAARPCVLVATPGELAGGLSLRAFRAWAGTKSNLTVTTRAVVGTVAHRLQAGEREIRGLGGRETLHVRCSVAEVALSAHADAHGIVRLIERARPDEVVLVHGDSTKMETLAQRIRDEFSVTVHVPGNHERMVWPATDRSKRLKRDQCD